MQVTQIIKELPNMIGVEYPAVFAKDENEEPVKMSDKTIQIMLKSGFEMFMASQGGASEKGVTAYHVRGKAIEGKVYSCNAIDDNGDECSIVLHQSDIPLELLPKKK